jgi:hypothetical protein
MKPTIKKITLTSLAIIAILVGSVLLAGCTSSPGQPVELKYYAGPGQTLVYQTKTVITGQNASEDIHTIEMQVRSPAPETIMWNATIHAQSINGTAVDTPLHFRTTTRGIVDVSTPDFLPVMTMNLPGTLEFTENPVRAGESWQNSPGFNGTRMINGVKVEYRYAAQDTYTFEGNGTVTVPAGTFACNRILHTGTSRITFTMLLDNKTVITTLDGKYSGENWVAADTGYLLKSDYTNDATTIIDTSSMTGDPLGLSMMGSTSQSQVSTELLR